MMLKVTLDNFSYGVIVVVAVEILSSRPNQTKDNA